MKRGGAPYLGRELPLGILSSPQVLDELFIFHCALQRGTGKSAALPGHSEKSASPPGDLTC